MVQSSVLCLFGYIIMSDNELSNRIVARQNSLMWLRISQLFLLTIVHRFGGKGSVSPKYPHSPCNFNCSVSSEEASNCNNHIMSNVSWSSSSRFITDPIWTLFSQFVRCNQTKNMSNLHPDKERFRSEYTEAFVAVTPELCLRFSS